MSNARKLADNLPTEGQLFERNVLVNGAMNVAQRATSASGVGSSFAYPTVDRWKIVPSTSGRASMAQNNDSPNGFNNSISLACTTADTSIGASEYFMLRQSIEGQDLQRFAKGTSDAKEFTVSFYVKGNASATYVVELEDTDNDRVCSKTFNVTTNWTRVILTFPADTTGAFDDDQNRSLNINIWLHAGSNYTSGTLNSSSFAARTNANRAVGISSVFDSTSRVFYITGCQLEAGPQSTPFEHRSFGDELARCQRYYFQEDTTTTNASGGLGVAAHTTAVTFDHPLPVRMRANPSVSLTSANLRIGDTVSAGFTTSSGSISISSYSGSARGVYNLNGFSGLTTYRTYLHEPDSTHPGIVVFNAEL